MEYELIEGTYRVKNHGAQLANCKEWVRRQIDLLPKSIGDPAELKAVKGLRADNNRQKDGIKDLRLKLNEQVLGTINAELKEYESELGLLEAECKRLVDDYKKRQDEAKKADVPEAPKSYCLRIYSFNADALGKVKAYAEKQGCTCDVL